MCVCLCFGGMYHSLHVEPKEELCRVGSLTFMWVHSQKVTYFNSWSLVSGTVREGLGGMGLLE